MEIFEQKVFIWWFPVLVYFIYDWQFGFNNITMSQGTQLLFFYYLALTTGKLALDMGKNESPRLSAPNFNMPIARQDEIPADQFTCFRDSIDAPIIGKWPINSKSVVVPNNALLWGKPNVMARGYLTKKKFKELPLKVRSQLLTYGFNIENVYSFRFWLKKHSENEDNMVDSTSELKQIENMIDEYEVRIQEQRDLLVDRSKVLEGEFRSVKRLAEAEKRKSVLAKAVNKIFKTSDDEDNN